MSRMIRDIFVPPIHAEPTVFAVFKLINKYHLFKQRKFILEC